MAVNQDMYSKIVALAAEEPMQEKTVEYLAERLRSFVDPGERVLICFQKHEKGNLSDLMARAVTRCGGRSVVWGEDHRWKSLLRLAFTSRATTIISTPLLVLGLSKLKKANATPLFIHNVVTAGYPCFDWMIDGIIKGFDCRTGGCLSLGISGVVAGFSCDHIRGVHLRDEEYTIGIFDENGNPLPDGAYGRWTISPRNHPDLRCCPGEFGRLDVSTKCTCGNPSPRLMELHPAEVADKELAELAQHLLSWTSVLDCSVQRGAYGLEIEMVIFPGEKLPKLPTCARQVIRPWNPEVDVPFAELPVRKNTADFADSH